MQTTNLEKEKEFFKNVSGLIFKLLSKKRTFSIKYKGQKDILDPVTSSDVAVENLLVKEIGSLFSTDAILGEESSSDLKIDPNVRTWILDPICGTVNYSRGFTNFCTNISLAHKDKIIAACVLDHARNETIWSIGNNEVYLNDSIAKQVNHPVPLIDVDLGGIYPQKDKRLKKKYINLLSQFLNETNYMPISHNTSLGFAYTAIGRLDGYLVIAPHLWDVAAANFLLTQSNGVVSDLSGNPWNLDSKSVLAAREKDVHQKLLDLYLNS